MNRLAIFLFVWWTSLGLLAQTGADDFRFEDGDLLPADSLAEAGLQTSADSLTAEELGLPWPQNVQQRMDALLERNASLLERSQVGLMVYDLTDDSCIYSRNHMQTLRPASTMKLLTAIAALSRLGSSYRFRTQLFYRGRIEDGRLLGDLVCMGGMDPLFNSDDLNAFVESLRSMDVDTVCGHIVADLSFKEDERYGEGWCWDDDNPVLTPLLISRKDGFVERFAEKLQEAGIVIDALSCQPDNRRKDAPLTLLCTRFHTIDQVLMPMMKDSKNLFAEAMFYQLAASTGNRPGKASHARSVIGRLLSSLGITSGYKIADGSGLSLYNYVSAHLLVRLLRYAYRNSDVFDNLYVSLPVAGQDGTLKSRMRGVFTNGNVHAKTGTLTGISSLAGYCTSANGHELCFAIINQGVLRNQDGRTFQDRVCTVLCEP